MDAQLELRLALCEGLSVVVCFVVGLSCAYKWAAFSCRRKHMAQLAGAPFSQTFAIAWFSIYVSAKHATLREHKENNPETQADLWLFPGAARHAARFSRHHLLRLAQVNNTWVPGRQGLAGYL